MKLRLYKLPVISLLVTVFSLFFVGTAVRVSFASLDSSPNFKDLGYYRKIIDEDPKAVLKRDTAGCTLLHYAAKGGNLECVKYLISKGMTGDAPDYEKLTPIHYAIMYGRFDIFRYLFNKFRADVHYESPDLMLTAIKYNRFEMIEFMLSKGMEVDIYALRQVAASGDEKILMLISKFYKIDNKVIDDYSLLHSAVKNNNEKAVKFLLVNGADVNAGNDSGLTPLHYAAAKGNTSLIKLLIKKGAKIDQVDHVGYSPLMRAALNNKVDAIKLLLSNHADVKIESYSGKNALIIAVINGNVKAVRALEAGGADVNRGSFLKSINLEYKKPISYAIDNNRINMVKYLVSRGALDKINKNVIEINSPLLYALTNKRIKILEYLLDSGFDVNAKDENGNTLLHLITINEPFSNDRREVAELLIKKGADPAELNNALNTPWKMAEENKAFKIASYLKYIGADAFQPDSKGKTALHYAAQRGDDFKLEDLIMTGFKIDGQDREGRTPLYYAVGSGDKFCVQLLVEAGANPAIQSRSGDSPLIKACREGNSEIISYMISKNTEEGLNDYQKVKITEIVIKEGSSEMIRKLIDKKIITVETAKRAKYFKLARYILMTDPLQGLESFQRLPFKERFLNQDNLKTYFPLILIFVFTFFFLVMLLVKLIKERLLSRGK